MGCNMPAISIQPQYIVINVSKNPKLNWIFKGESLHSNLLFNNPKKIPQSQNPRKSQIFNIFKPQNSQNFHLAEEVACDEHKLGPAAHGTRFEQNFSNRCCSPTFLHFILSRNRPSLIVSKKFTELNLLVSLLLGQLVSLFQTNCFEQIYRAEFSG